MTGARSSVLAGLLAASALAGAPLTAQHGHPLVGSWSGNWLRADGRQQRLLLVLEYEQDTISGSIFFGTRRVALGSAELDPTSWSIRLEAAEQSNDGAAISYVLDGRIENLGSTTERAISGTLSSNGDRGDFRVVMN